MKRMPLVAGNWKMNNDERESLALVDALGGPLEAIAGVDVVLCPPFTALSALVAGLRGRRIALGAQNMHWEDKGAFTGEISPLMLKLLVSHVILGHSERRQFGAETDAQVNLKVLAAVRHDLSPIMCVGENLQQYEGGETRSAVERQVRAGLKDVPAAGTRRLVIAYEPVWAIGTGKAATGAGANAVIGLTIRGVLSDLYGEQTAQSVRVLYGGSLTPANMGEFMQQPDIDGGLIGGASLKAGDFVKMVEIAGAF